MNQETSRESAENRGPRFEGSSRPLGGEPSARASLAGDRIPPLGPSTEARPLDIPPLSGREAASESVIDANSTFNGRFETAQGLRVHGNISGEVACQGRFTVEASATARAKVDANEAVIFGQFEGELSCSGRLTLASTAVVNGTVKAGTLVVEEGATLTGSVETGSTVSAATSRRAGRSEPAPNDERSFPKLSKRPAPSFAVVGTEERDAEAR